MSHYYQPIIWNKIKRQYDLLIALFTISFLFFFVILNLWFYPEITKETLLIRAFGILAILMLHLILVIGPLCRINSKFLPLLYNRRHLGVTMFFMASIHGGLSIVQFHGYGNEHPLISVFLSNTQYNSLLEFPFQTLGAFALIILMFMAVTSHDFWLKNLGPVAWKSLHMTVYIAYVALISHVVLGALQDETSPYILILVITGFFMITGLHIVAAIRSKLKQKSYSSWVPVAKVADVPENGAKIIRIQNKKIAVFKYEDKLSAVSNYCRHQGGPLGEGKIVEGCITCPWHGYQYYPDNGCSPPPFEEKIETYDLKIDDNLVYVNPDGHPEGTYVKPLELINRGNE